MYINTVSDKSMMRINFEIAFFIAHKTMDTSSRIQNCIILAIEIKLFFKTDNKQKVFEMCVF